MYGPRLPILTWRDFWNGDTAVRFLASAILVDPDTTRRGERAV